jgi:hypothetical protein
LSKPETEAKARAVATRGIRSGEANVGFAKKA